MGWSCQPTFSRIRNQVQQMQTALSVEQAEEVQQGVNREGDAGGIIGTTRKGR